MSIKFNPSSGNFDFVGASSPGTSYSPYSDTFIVGDWVVSGSDYEITYTQATHGKGLNPTIHVYELTGGVYEEVSILNTVNSVTGLVTIKVNGTPDLRFQGKIVIN